MNKSFGRDDNLLKYYLYLCVQLPLVMVMIRLEVVSLEVCSALNWMQEVRWFFVSWAELKLHICIVHEHTCAVTHTYPHKRV